MNRRKLRLALTTIVISTTIGLLLGEVVVLVAIYPWPTLIYHGNDPAVYDELRGYALAGERIAAALRPLLAERREAR